MSLRYRMVFICTQNLIIVIKCLHRNYCRGKFMLTNYYNYLCSGVLLVTLILYACAGYSYSLNAKRAADDPKKLDISLGVVLLAPFTWPLLFIGVISLFIIRALLYGVFLVLLLSVPDRHDALPLLILQALSRLPKRIGETRVRIHNDLTHGWK